MTTSPPSSTRFRPNPYVRLNYFLITRKWVSHGTIQHDNRRHSTLLFLRDLNGKEPMYVCRQRGRSSSHAPGRTGGPVETARRGTRVLWDSPKRLVSGEVSLPHPLAYVCILSQLKTHGSRINTHRQRRWLCIHRLTST